MHGLSMRASAAVAAVSALTAFGMSGVSAAGAAAQALLPPAGAVSLQAVPAPTVPGAQLWVRRYNVADRDVASMVAVSPGGARVFVTGGSARAGTGYAYATVAYSAATGARLWLARYNSGSGEDFATSLAVSPDGKAVFVTGHSSGAGTSLDYATVAYDAATGDRLWVARYTGPGRGTDWAHSLAVSPDGASVYVTGASTGPRGYEYATVAYDAATGARLWVARYNVGRDDMANSVAVSPDGTRVFVTGGSRGPGTSLDYATVAYDAATGTQLWIARYNDPGNGADWATSAATHAGQVYVTGRSVTIAYNAATGAQLWTAPFRGTASSLVVSPAGAVFVTGKTAGAGTNHDYRTVAYSAAGRQLWARQYSATGVSDDAAAFVAAPGNGKVYVTGTSSQGDIGPGDYVTIAYGAATGARLWLARYNGPANSIDYAASVAATASRVFVTGTSYRSPWPPPVATDPNLDYATVAYHA